MTSLDRRTFMTMVGAGAFAGSRSLLAQTGGRRIANLGVQLYTVRAEMEKDFDGTLARVAAAGYKEVEFAGYFSQSPQAVKASLTKHGLAAPSAHIDFASLAADKFPKVLETSKAIGHQFVVLSWLDDELRRQADVWKRVVAALNRAGAESKKAGIQLAYHNHHFEFVPVGGKLPFDILLADCDPNLVKIEMDLCWMIVAGKDPVAYFRKYSGRFPMVHVKDVKKVSPLMPADNGMVPFERVFPDMTEVGSGMIDWKTIIAAAAAQGTTHFFVEHDQPEVPIESITTSAKYLAALRY